MQVRSTPRKASAKASSKAPAAKKTKKQQTQFPSTNVDSPVRGNKQTIRSFAYNQDDDDDDEDVFDAPRHPSRKQANRSFQADGFVIGDDDGFAPVRVAKPLKATKAKKLGTPITTDQRTAELTELQSDVLRDFMTGAKRMRTSIQERKGHREAIFTDTVLREMGLDLPRNLDEMKTIPGIRPEMVDRYGKSFLKLINNTRNFYGDDTPVPRNPQLRNKQAQSSRTVYEIDDDDNDYNDDDEEVDDQNHRLVVDLCGDDDDDDDDEVEEADAPITNAEEFADDSSYGDLDYDDDEDGEVHTSHHFSHAPNADVADFNNRYTQLGGGAAPVSKAAAKAPASRSGYKKKGTFKKRTSGNFGNKSFGGVKKRAARGSSSRASAGASSRPRGGGAGGGGGGGPAGGGWGSIMAMPT